MVLIPMTPKHYSTHTWVIMRYFNSLQIAALHHDVRMCMRIIFFSASISSTLVLNHRKKYFSQNYFRANLADNEIDTK